MSEPQRVIGDGQQVIAALNAVPDGEAPPPEVVAVAREVLRETKTALAEIERAAKMQAMQVRGVRDQIMAFLYERTSLQVARIAWDAGVTDATLLRRIGPVRRRHPQRGRRQAPIAYPARRTTVEDVADEDTGVANIARMYDYVLGGTASYPIDRETMDRWLDATPEVRNICLANRAFLGRAVRHMARAGLRQFLDLGSGLATQGNVHEIAREVEPDARIVYVDKDPYVPTYNRAHLGDIAGIGTVLGDIRDPDQIIAHPTTRALIDVGKPVAVLMVAILHFINDDDARRAVAYLRDAVPSGSYMALTHVSIAGTSRLQDANRAVTNLASTWPRTSDQIMELIGGWPLLPPGLVTVPQWRPDRPVGEADEQHMWLKAAVARKP